jgi:hypothetical protein
MSVSHINTFSVSNLFVLLGAKVTEKNNKNKKCFSSKCRGGELIHWRLELVRLWVVLLGTKIMNFATSPCSLKKSCYFCELKAKTGIEDDESFVCLQWKTITL